MERRLCLRRLRGEDGKGMIKNLGTVMGMLEDGEKVMSEVA